MPRTVPLRKPSVAPKGIGADGRGGDHGVGAGQELVEVLRQVIRRAAARPAAATGLNGRRVILDVEVDGVRCLFVELPPRDRPREVVVLSPREREIARMVSKGYATKTIAAVLEISMWTVGTYLRRIFAKLGVGTRAAMVARLQELDSYPDTGTPGPGIPDFP